MQSKLVLPLLIIISLSLLTAEPQRYQEPDERFDTDILLVVAHPDDETAIGSYLAKTVFDDERTVSIVYTNRGSGGGNSTGVEQSLAMGAEREIEVRRAVAEFDITAVWFLEGRDTPGQDVFHSLGNLNQGAALEKLIRIIRLTRPEVILTWLPHFVSGENHGDHQASGVLATEAFDLAGDPTTFPAQVTAPREYYDINNFNEGLRPWQAQKLYYFSDADRELNGFSPPFDINAVSSSQHKPYYQLAARLHVHHQTQGDVADMAEQALATGNWQPMLDFIGRFHLIFGKSLVGGRSSDDVFHKIRPEPLEFKPATGYRPGKGKGVVISFGGAFNYYRQFWAAHDIEHLVKLVEPELMVSAGSYVHIPLLITNHSAQEVVFSLKRNLPEGWADLQQDMVYSVPSGNSYPLQTFYFAPDRITVYPDILRWEVFQEQKSLGKLEMKIDIREWTLPH